MNCLIGPGDSGKSTILDAIELCLSPRRYAVLGESDFHMLNTSTPIMVEVTLGGLEDELIDLEVYASYLRGYAADGSIEDEPRLGLETILTVRVEAKDDLVPRWRLFTERTKDRDDTRDLSAKDRARIAPTRLGAYADAHLAWGQRSILNRIGEERPDAGVALKHARSAAKKAFNEQVGTLFDAALEEVGKVAIELAVNIGDRPQALLDTQQVSMGSGTVALHDGNDVPLRNLGLGSSRLVVAGLQRRAGIGAIALVDEIEHGLEPYRIAQLLHVLGSKGKNAPQVFMTTHSPVTLRELSSEQIVVIRRPESSGGFHKAIAAGADEQCQKTLRACAEAFLTPSILVCEGKTEVGLMREIDLHFHEKERLTLACCGVFAADGGGSEGPSRALVFAEMGYRTALFRDSDRELGKKEAGALKAAGVVIFEWTDDLATEAAFFRACPDAAIPQLLSIAIDTRTEKSVEDDIAAVSDGKLGIEQCLAAPGDPEVRSVLGAASVRKDKNNKPRNWFKMVEPGERVGHEVVPAHFKEFEKSFRDTLKSIINWVRNGHT